MVSTATVSGGQRLHYTDHGGHGPAVVLLHSFLMDGEMFAPQVAALGEEFRLITVDERGHGGTPADEPFDYWEVARDVLALLDQLDIQRAAVVGTSQGGFIAMRMALSAPERISALAVLGTSAAAEDAETAANYRQVAEAWADNGPVDQLLDMVAIVCLGDMDAEVWKAKWRKITGSHFNRILTPLVERDGLLSKLNRIECPVLVLHGSGDRAYPVCRAAEIVEGVPNAEPLVVVDGGAHFLSLTDAEAVDPHLRGFLRKHTS
jgi:pimeloyl-ACP methyl ester carboxylesterase